MSLTAHSMSAPAPARRRSKHAAVIAGPQPQGDRTLLTWAFNCLAAAEQRVADLQTRLAYLEGLTVTDELTRLLNRRGFLAELGRALESARLGGPQGVVMIGDLDGFKGVNDRFGHNAGNRVLRELAASLIRRVRRTDAVARLGGDEFGFLLVGATLPSAQQKVRDLEHAIANLGISIDGVEIELSASFGFVAYDGSEAEEPLLHRADMAMYERKRLHGAHKVA
ncbi:MAG TPA: GGDEF domain-containing protein [Stellaceae bacterium]|nr:GGDEF domain-containing protein [Stellaceae bacterium]